jgi:hypothetical protein
MALVEAKGPMFLYTSSLRESEPIDGCKFGELSETQRLAAFMVAT